MRAEDLFRAATMELEALRKEFAVLQLIDEGRCVDVVHQQPLIENLILENGLLQRRLKMHNCDRVVCGLFVILASIYIMWCVYCC